MNESGLDTMETIHEMIRPNPKTAIMPRSKPSFEWAAEEALFSVVRSSQHKPTPDIATSVRSASLKMPVPRKPSHRVREWVKRSNSSR